MAATTSAAGSLRSDATVISLVGFSHATSHFFHFVLPPLFPFLMTEFGLTFTQVGAAMTAFFVVSGIGQAIAGFVVDRVGAFKVLCGGVAVLAVAGLVLAAAQSYAMVLAAWALAGLGNSVFHPADLTLLNRRVSPSRLGHGFSVHGLSGNLGWAAGAAFSLALAEAAGWRSAAIGASLVGAAALAFLFLNRATLRGGEPAPEARRGSGSAAFLRIGVIWMCFAFFLLSVMAFGALQNFAPPVLERTYSISFALATTGLTAYLLGSAAGTALGGFFTAGGERHERLIGAALAVAAACALLIASGKIPVWAVIGGMGLMGFAVGFIGPSRDFLVRRAATSRLGGNAFGRVYGFVYSGIDSGLAIAPLAFGLLMDAGRFAEVLWGVAILQALAIAVAFGVGRRAHARAQP